MELKYLNKRIIAAVAQRPFPSKQNVFCKLIPLFNHLDAYDKGFSEPFYNDGEIWWMLPSAMSSQHVVPGMLMEVDLEESPNADPDSPDASLYQVQSVASEVGAKSGAEVFSLIGETEKSIIARFKGDGGVVKLPHAPTRIVFLRASGNVYGPFAATVRDDSSEDLSVKVHVQPFLNNKCVYRMESSRFAGEYHLLSASESVSRDKQPRSRSTAKSEMSWEFLPPDELKRVENGYGSDWSALDFESLAAKISHLAGSIDGFKRGERQEARKLIARLEQALTTMDDPTQLRSTIAGVTELTDAVEQNIHTLIQVLVEGGLINEDRIRKAEKEYLDKWIATQTNEINQGIASKQKELDELTQRAEQEKAKFEFEARRREKDLQDRIEHDLKDLDQMKSAAKTEIESERNGWESERQRLMAEFKDKEESIGKLLDEIRSSAENSAEVAVRMYPFLHAAQEPVARGTGDDGVLVEPAQKRTFEIPAVLKSGCSGSRIACEQKVFLEQLQDYAEANGLHYAPEDLRRFHVSVLCEGLTILAGPSGVGKSSLARLYGKVLSGGADEPRDGTHVIHVGPSWLERSDILGYVNTVTGEFAPSETGLFQRLVYAHEDYSANDGDSALYPFCLDEMNLSQIEHYFNDFMQLLEKPVLERKLRCFSPDAVKLDSLFLKYATLPIAPTVRFIGTVNFDETTRRMSSRLLDRVNLICLADATSGTVGGKGGRLGLGRGVSYATFSSWVKTGNLSPAAEQCLADMAPVLRRLGTSVSPRVHAAMKRYVATAIPLIDSSTAEKVAFDEQVAQRVLSKIRSLNGTQQLKALDELEGVLLDYCDNNMVQSGRVIASLREESDAFDLETDLEA